MQEFLSFSAFSFSFTSQTPSYTECSASKREDHREKKKVHIFLKFSSNVSCCHLIWMAKALNLRWSFLVVIQKDRKSKQEHLYHPAGPRLCSIRWHFANANNLVGWLSAFETKRQLSTLVLDPSALKKKKKVSLNTVSTWSQKAIPNLINFSWGIQLHAPATSELGKQ